jgi:hypothetical protein
MFGSLVLIFPTVHEGGALLRQGGKEWTFNSADAVWPSLVDPSPQVAFIAFFSDVEHEVTTISSGYRVTLTYNLYRKSSAAPPNSAYKEVDTQLKESLARLLEDRSFLPEGGTLGFGLDHKYPINPKKTKLGDITNCLKGMDESIKRVCESLGLKVTLRPVYGFTDEYSVVLDCFVDLADMEKDEDVAWYLSSFEGAMVLCHPGKEKEAPHDLQEKVAPIVWIKELSETNAFSNAIIGSGNQAEIDYIYGEVCLIVEVAPAEKRL